jgi:hypothetical protein
MSPGTSIAGKEFLKSKLRDDYYELKGLLPHIHKVAEEENIKYEVYDRQTGKVVGGPYSSRSRARLAADKKDNEYGAYRYSIRPVPVLKEAVHKLPLSHDDFEAVIEVMKRPIPAAIAPIYISEIIEDDELNDLLTELEDSDPGCDVRPFIAEWFKRVMPDQLYRFNGDHPSHAQKNGVLSPIHGYDSHMYKGQNDPLTGNAYGFR